ncbi:MAG: BMP family protein [Haloarculaceae archaeon]
MVSRRDVLKASGVGLTVGLAGCSGGRGTDDETTDDGDGGGGGGGGGGDGGDTPTGTETESQTPLPGEDVNVGVIYARGGLGDQSFSDAANRGIRRAREELGISFTNAEPQSTSDFNSFQRRFAESTDPDYDLIVCVGFEHVAPLQENANTYSDQQWAQLDAVVDRSNVESWVYAEEQGSYLVGQSAAQLSTMEFSAGPSATDPSNTVLGFVGGIEAPVVQAFEAGFRAGAKSVDSGFEVLSSYVGDFSSPGVAEETAQSMIDQGADVLYHGAGAGGVGVFRAAQNNGVFAFGADSRQSETVPDFANVILGSMVKGVDTSAFRAVEHVVNDNFQGGNTFELGAGEGGFELIWSDSIGTEVPQEVKDAVVATKEELAAGNIDVPATPS